MPGLDDEAFVLARKSKFYNNLQQWITWHVLCLVTLKVHKGNITPLRCIQARVNNLSVKLLSLYIEYRVAEGSLL